MWTVELIVLTNLMETLSSLIMLTHLAEKEASIKYE